MRLPRFSSQPQRAETVTMNAAKILFAGTPKFALASLRALVAAGSTPMAVLTQPDRPAGRGKKIRSSVVKAYSVDKNIPVLQPVNLQDSASVAEITAIEPDIMVVAAYGLIIPQAMLDLPAHGCVNVHASLLPRWRGAAPIQRAILAGDVETGISLMKMEAGLDTGPIYAQASLDIGPNESAGELNDRLAHLGGELLSQKLPDILLKKLAPVEQDEKQSIYAQKIFRDDARINWDVSAEEIQRQIRAFNPIPGAWFDLAGEPIKCWKAEVLPDFASAPGVVVQVGKGGIEVKCGKGVLRLLEVQRPGRRRVSGTDFGSQINLVGVRFG